MKPKDLIIDGFDMGPLFALGENRPVPKALHPGLVRRRKIKLRTPRWANRERIEQVYKQARNATLITGIEHVVDHVVPLGNSKVSGLHWENNLQILTKAENERKQDRFWPDMWMEQVPLGC